MRIIRVIGRVTRTAGRAARAVAPGVRRTGDTIRLAATLALAVVVLLPLPAVALAASPTPTRPASLDTRSPLEGPGFVGSPGSAILVVAVIALAAVIVTTLYVRLSRGPDEPRA